MRLRVGLIGLGTVGSAVARRLVHGDQQRLQLVRVCRRPGRRDRPGWLAASVDCTDRFDALLAPDIDVIVELVGGVLPAREWIERALVAGKSVVTANKQLIAECGAELLALAGQRRRHLRFEGAVGGGIPIIRAVQDGLAGDRLVRLEGVLNGTCNYILSRMERDASSFADALADAQAHGFAEADPRADVDGLDARAKLAVLCAVGFGVRVRPETIACRSIARITAQDLARARERGGTIRQVSRATRPPAGRGDVTASVGPELVPLDSPLARAHGCENVIVVTGVAGGTTTFSGQGAGGDATSVAVVSDLLAIARDTFAGASSPRRFHPHVDRRFPAVDSSFTTRSTKGTLHHA